MKKSLFKKSVVGTVSALLISSNVLSPVSYASMASLTGWKQEGNIWRYYAQDGKLGTGWVLVGSDWYYLNPADGTMKTGWLQTADGNWYYLNTNPGGGQGKMLTGWQKIGNNWHFFNTSKHNSEGKILTGWQWIDGYSYYFGVSSPGTPARMYAGEKTPDGYYVNAEGKWAETNGELHYVAGKGINTKITTPAANAKLNQARAGAVSGGGRSSSGGSGRSSSGRGGSSSVGGSSLLNDGNYLRPDTNEDSNSNKELLVTASTKMVDLGWIKYSVIHFEQGTYTDYDIYVDGTKVNSAISKVDDAGKLVKWASTVLNPREVKVVRKSDKKEQTLAFEGGNNTTTPSAGSLETSPAYILTNGPVSVFDYHIDNYDKEGRVRKKPKTTTFDLNNARGKEKVSAKLPTAYYSPDAEIDAAGNGVLKVKLTLNQESENWFDNLVKIKLLDSDNRVINGNLTFETAKETTYGNTGVVTVSLPQSNLNSRGRYYINLVSSIDEASYTVPVHLVSRVKYKAVQSTETPNPKVGEDILFRLEGENGETFGTDVKKVVNRVELKYPSGKIRSLKEYSEYSVIFYSLHIYGTDNGKDGTGDVLTDEAGVYEVSVYADGYKKISKRFEVAPKAGETAASTGIDMYSSATGGGSSSVNTGSTSEGSRGSSSVMNGWLVFDHDLLANALILNELGLRNEAATNIINRWHAQHPEGVFGKEVDVIYDKADFLNEVKEARLDENKVLTFAEYKKNSTKTMPHPGQIKRVLEDGLLGAVERLAESKGKDVEFTGTSVNEGEDFNIVPSDNEYFSKVTDIYLDGNGTALRSDSYLKQYEIKDGKLIIFADTIKNSYGMPVVGEHNLKVYADGYKVQDIRLVVKGKEFNFELELNNNPKAREGADENAYFVGDEISFKANANFLSKLSTVRIKKLPDGNLKQVFYKGQGGRLEGYTTSGENIILESEVIKEAGKYKLFLVTANGQKNLEFEVKADAGENKKNTVPVEPKTEDNEETKEAPVFASAEKKSNKYLLKFGTSNDTNAEEQQAIKAWLEADNFVLKVNQTSYTKGLVVLGNNNYMTANDPIKGGVYRFLELSSSAFVDGNNTVEISADGYKTLSFTINQAKSEKAPVKPENPKNGKGELPPSVDVPKNDENTDSIYEPVEAKYVKQLIDSHYLIKFGNTEDQSELKKINDWLKNKDLLVKVNEKEVKNYFGYTIANDEARGGAFRYIKFKEESVQLNEGDNTVEISTKTDDKVSFILNKTGSTLAIKKGTVSEKADKLEGSRKDIEPKASIPDISEDADSTYKPVDLTYVKKLVFGNEYVIKFGKTEDKEELKKVNEWLKTRGLVLKVNGRELRSYFDYVIASDRVNGGPNRYIELKEEAAKLNEGENTLEISADKYEDVSFIIVKTGNSVALKEAAVNLKSEQGEEKPELGLKKSAPETKETDVLSAKEDDNAGESAKAAPSIRSIAKQVPDGLIYTKAFRKVYFNKSADMKSEADLTAYLKADDFEIKINGEVLSKVNYSGEMTGYHYNLIDNNYGWQYDGIRISEAALTKEKNILEISVAGYKTLRYEIDRD